MAGIPKTFFGRKVYDGHAFLNILKAEKEIVVSSNTTNNQQFFFTYFCP